MVPYKQKHNLQVLDYLLIFISLALTLLVVLDAIIVGMDMLIKKYGETYKGKKRLCLLTNAQFPIKYPLEGTKEDQVSTIAEHMNTHGMRMESIVVRGSLTGEANKSVMDENDNLLGIFSRKTCAKLVHVESPTSLLGALRTRKISPVTIFRGDLELSPKMKIKVSSLMFCQSKFNHTSSYLIVHNY